MQTGMLGEYFFEEFFKAKKFAVIPIGGDTRLLPQGPGMFSTERTYGRFLEPFFRTPQQEH